MIIPRKSNREGRSNEKAHTSEWLIRWIPDNRFLRGFGTLFIYLFIIFSFIFIGWRLITLQYCSGFCHTLAWISHGFTCIPHLFPPPTSLSTRFLWVFPVHQGWALGTLNVMWIHPLKLFTQQIFIKHESWADKRDTLKWMGSWSQSNEKIWEVRILKEINWKYWKWGLKHELFEIETMEEGL